MLFSRFHRSVGPSPRPSDFVRRLCVESLECRRLLSASRLTSPFASSLTELGESPLAEASPFPSQVSPRNAVNDQRLTDTQPAIIGPATTGQATGNRTAPFDIQTIDWNGRPATSVAGEWIVKLAAPIRRPERLSSAESGPNALPTVEFLQPLTTTATSDLWVVSAPIRFSAQQVTAAISHYGVEVELVEPNFVVVNNAVPNDPKFREQWALTDRHFSVDVDVVDVWDQTTGAPDLVIAAFDSGLDYHHPDLTDNVWRNPREVPHNGLDDDGNGFVDDLFGVDVWAGDADPIDVDGHGTHTAGILGAIGNNGEGGTGVAWKTQIMPIKFLSDSGYGSNDKAILGMNYMLMMKRDFGINIVASNHSWSGAEYSQILDDLIAESIDLGILFITSAGNDGQDNDASPTYPAAYNHDGVITVAATDRQGNLAEFSRYGATTVDLAAPGDAILSTEPGGTYGMRNGTSMSAPFVTGAVALVKSLYPGASPAEVKSAILDGVDPLPTLAGKTVSGGSLSISGAVDGIGFFVNLTTPAVGGMVAEKPTRFRLELSHDTAEFDLLPGAFEVNGVGATTVTQTSGNTLTFEFATSPVVADGPQVMRLLPGVVRRSGDNEPNREFLGEFRYDSVDLSVVGAVPPSGAAVETPWTHIDLTFNEPVDPSSLDTTDLWVSTADVIAVEAVTPNVVRFELTPSIHEQDDVRYRLYDRSIRDMYGNVFEGPFDATIDLDFGQVAFPAEWERVEPLAARAAYRDVQGTLSTPTDVDQFVVSLVEGQRFSVTVQSQASIPALELSNSNGRLAPQISSRHGERLWATWEIAEDGDHVLSLRNQATPAGPYRLTTEVNSIAERETALGLSNDAMEKSETILDLDVDSRELSTVTGVLDAPSTGDDARDGGDVDYYRFTKTADPYSIHVESAFRAGVQLALFDEAGERQAVGRSNGKHAQTIENVSLASGVYYVRVSGVGPYALVLARGASFDNGRNHTPSLAQQVDNTVIHGYVDNRDIVSDVRSVREEVPPGTMVATALTGAVPGTAPPSSMQSFSPITFEPTRSTNVVVADEPILPGDYLVTFSEDASCDVTQAAAARSDRVGLDAIGVVVTREFPVFCAAAVRVNEATTESALAALGIRHIEVDGSVQGQGMPPNEFRFPEQWGLQSGRSEDDILDTDIDLIEAFEFDAPRRPVVVAVVDTGIDWKHADLIETVWQNRLEVAGNGVDDDGNGVVDDVWGYDFVNGDASPDDDSGHGTHLAGIVGAVRDNHRGVVGVADDVRLLAVKVLDASRQGKLSDVIAGLQYVFITATTHDINIAAALTSWTTEAPSELLEVSLESMRQLGILVVASAGNTGQVTADNLDAPQASFPLGMDRPGVVSVAATDRSGRLAEFSTPSGIATIAAPGVNILSTLPDGQYGYLSGTSTAAAFVAGAAAVIASVDASSTPESIKAALIEGSDRTLALDGLVAASGRLNLADSLQAVLRGGDLFKVRLSHDEILDVEVVSKADESAVDDSVSLGVRLFDGDGELLAVDNGDGQLSWSDNAGSDYYIQVFARSGAGPYKLSIHGSATRTFEVGTATVDSASREVRLDFTDHVSLPSVGDDAFLIDGQSVVARFVDADSVVLSPTSVLPPGQHVVAVTAHSLTSLSGTPILPYTKSFEVVARDPDFDGDGILGCGDVAILQAATRSEDADMSFDLNGDGDVNSGDVLVWIEDERGTLPGDVNLDGVVDGSDLNIWYANRSTLRNAWCTGDLTSNAAVDVLDWNVWYDRRFTARYESDTAQAHRRPQPAFEESIDAAIASLDETANAALHHRQRRAARLRRNITA